MAPKREVEKAIRFYLTHFKGSVFENHDLEFKNYFPWDPRLTGDHYDRFLHAVCGLHNSGTMYGSLKNPQFHSVYMVLNWKEPSRDEFSPNRCLSDHLTYQLDQDLVSDLEFDKDYTEATNDFFNCFNVPVQFHLHPLCLNPVEGENTVALMEIRLNQSPLEITANAVHSKYRGIHLRCGPSVRKLSMVPPNSSWFQTYSARFNKCWGESFSTMILLFNSSTIFGDVPSWKPTLLHNLLGLPFIDYADDPLSPDVLRSSTLKTISYSSLNYDSLLSVRNSYIFEFPSTQLPKLLAHCLIEADDRNRAEHLLPILDDFVLPNDESELLDNLKHFLSPSAVLLPYVTQVPECGLRYSHRFLRLRLPANLTVFPVADEAFTEDERNVSLRSFLKGSKPSLQLFTKDTLIPSHQSVSSLQSKLLEKINSMTSCSVIEIVKQDYCCGGHTSILLALRDIARITQSKCLVYEGSSEDELLSYLPSVVQLYKTNNLVVYCTQSRLKHRLNFIVKNFSKENSGVKLAMIYLVTQQTKIAGGKNGLQYVSPHSANVFSDTNFYKKLKDLLTILGIPELRYKNLTENCFESPDFLYLGLSLFAGGFSKAKSVLMPVLKKCLPNEKNYLFVLALQRVYESISNSSVDAELSKFLMFETTISDRFVSRSESKYHINLSVAKFIISYYLKGTICFFSAISDMLSEHKCHHLIVTKLFVPILSLEGHIVEELNVFNRECSPPQTLDSLGDSDGATKLLSHWQLIEDIAKGEQFVRQRIGVFHSMTRLLKRVRINHRNCEEVFNMVEIVHSGYRNCSGNDAKFVVSLADLYRYSGLVSGSNKVDRLLFSFQLYLEGLDSSMYDSENFSEQKKDDFDNSFILSGIFKIIISLFEHFRDNPNYQTKSEIMNVCRSDVARLVDQVSISSLIQLDVDSNNGRPYLPRLASCGFFDFDEDLVEPNTIHSLAFLVEAVLLIDAIQTSLFSELMSYLVSSEHCTRRKVFFAVDVPTVNQHCRLTELDYAVLCGCKILASIGLDIDSRDTVKSFLAYVQYCRHICLPEWLENLRLFITWNTTTFQPKSLQRCVVEPSLGVVLSNERLVVWTPSMEWSSNNPFLIYTTTCLYKCVYDGVGERNWFVVTK
ncbi:hypothetical protein P9112_004904 [Eukaryota sp. TZLM1-RC]